jgi:hypothetical protein
MVPLERGTDGGAESLDLACHMSSEPCRHPTRIAIPIIRGSVLQL